MAGLTLEQLKELGAKPVAQPKGFTLEELQAKGAKVAQPETEPSYLGSFVGRGRLKENVEESARMRAEKIKASLAGQASPLKKTLDVGSQVIAGAIFDPVGNIVSALVPNWIKERFKTGVEKTQEPIRRIMEEKGLVKPGEKIPTIMEEISGAIGKRVDEPTQYMVETQARMFEQSQQIRDKAFTETDPVKKKLLEDTALGMEKAAQEINKSIQSTQSRREELARGAETTEILGTLATGFVPKAKTIPTIKAQTGKVIDLTLDEADGIFKTLTQSTPEQLEQQLANFYSKAVKPSVAGKMTIPQANKAVGNQIVAISLINKNIPKLKFMENGVEVVGRAPESMQELAEAVSQTKADIFNRYNTLATAANEKGATVNLNSIADELEKIATSPVVADNAPEIARYARNIANSYRARGEYDIITAQDVIKLYNEKLQAFYRQPTPDYTTKAVVDAMVVNKMRELADAVIEKAQGAGYAELKRQYGALKSIEKEVVHRAIVEARKNTKGLLDFVDIASGAQAINWITTGNVGALLQAGGMKAIAAYYKYLNSVNYNLRKMFESATKLEKAKGQTPPKSRIIKSLKNPKAGLSIERVGQPKEMDLVKVLRGTKGMTANDIMATYPNIKLKKDVPTTMLDGTKAIIPKGEKLTPYELKGNKILLQDGETYIVSKNQFQNIKGQSVVAEGKPFAPELKGVEETLKQNWKEKQADIFARKDKGLITKEQMNKELDALGVDAGGKEMTPTKYEAYQLPGGKNYKEILIKAPVKPTGTKEQFLTDFRKRFPKNVQSDTEVYSMWERGLTVPKEGQLISTPTTFKSSHWDEPNVISHLRMNERTYKGKKVAFMEELQSDWAREGRSKGFATDITKEKAQQMGYSVHKKDGSYFISDPENATPGMRTGAFGYDTEIEAWNAVTKRLKEYNNAVPNHPLLKNWQEPTIKRALKEAVDTNADYFAWINGEQTSARYNLETYLDKTSWKKFGQDGKIITLNPKQGETIQIITKADGTIRPDMAGGGMRTEWQGKKLDEVLGKGLADKIIADESGTLSGEGLKFGGEWATNLYGSPTKKGQVANIVEDLTGGKVVGLDMGLPIDNKTTQWRTQISKTGNNRFAVTKPVDIKIGQMLGRAGENSPADDLWIIIDTLGGGKFKAVPKDMLETSPSGNYGEWIETTEGKKWFNTDYVENFDINTKTTTQQGIKLTPEIKAKIKGLAPKIKTSGRKFE